MEFNILPNTNSKGLAPDLTRTNEYLKKFGLVLTKNDAIRLSASRNTALKNCGRIEFSNSATEKIVKAFCDSQYINQDSFVDVLEELIEIFYYFKSETLDLIPDDELIGLMKEYYENRCKGSLELLKHRELEQLSKNIKYGIKNYEDLDEDNNVQEEGLYE